jgi:hypothetical protein
MNNTSVNLFESIATIDVLSPLPKISQVFKGAGYYGSNNPMHTVIFSTANNWIGELRIQATLVTKPTEQDWFDIKSAVFGDGINIQPDGAKTVSFNGNFVWVRAKLTKFTSGQINRVQYTHN